MNPRLLDTNNSPPAANQKLNRLASRTLQLPNMSTQPEDTPIAIHMSAFCPSQARTLQSTMDEGNSSCIYASTEETDGELADQTGFVQFPTTILTDITPMTSRLYSLRRLLLLA